MEEKAVREFRVWLETGDLLGCASVYKRRAWWTVELEPFYTDEKIRSKGFRNQQDAYDFAKEYAETYMQQAIEYERDNFHAEGDWEEEFSSSYHIQICEDGRNVEL
jgi:hypothetical protein